MIVTIRETAIAAVRTEPFPAVEAPILLRDVSGLPRRYRSGALPYPYPMYVPGAARSARA